MKSRFLASDTGLHARCLILLALTGSIAGCAGGPKLSLSPSKWPGARQVAKTGRKIGGLARWKGDAKKQSNDTNLQQVAQKESSRQKLAAETNDKGRPIYDRGVFAGRGEPVDPFLARAARANRQVEKVSHSKDVSGGVPQQGGPTDDLSDFFNGGLQEKKPGQAALSKSDDNAFADLTDSAARTVKSAGRENQVGNTFADGFDSRLAKLRDESNPQPTEVAPDDSSPLRAAILGMPAEADVTESVAMAVPVSDSTDEDAEPTGRAVVQSDIEADDGLPDWARSEPNLPVRTAVKETQEEAVPTPVPDLTEPPAEDAVPESPQMVADVHNIPTLSVELQPPTAIEIVPAPTILDRQFPFDADVADSNASDRVELLPAPEETSPVFGKVDQTSDGFGGMIVESETLPTGFADWQGSHTTATAVANGHPDIQASGSSASDSPLARFAVNTRRQFGDPQSSDQIGEDGVPHAFADDTRVTSNESTSQIAIEPRMFLSEDEGPASAKRELEVVNWNSDSEPGVEAAASPFGSTVIISLLIGLACLIGIGLFRRMSAAA